MTISEKIAHLKGLAEGLGIQPEESKESRLLVAMLSVLEDMSAAIAELEDNSDLINEELDELSDELMALEQDVYWEDEDDDYHFGEDDEDEYDYDEYDDEEEPTYLVECPVCGEEMLLEEDTLLSGQIRCAECGQLFSLELVEEEDDGEEPEEDEPDGE